jgi:hypothetical protein
MNVIKAVVIEDASSVDYVALYTDLPNTFNNGNAVLNIQLKPKTGAKWVEEHFHVIPEVDQRSAI